jgi:glycosyltransferase involved in cell wall biosynthesis
MARPLVSIIVPTYNEEYRIEGCLRGLHELACIREWGEDVEVIVVDDGSKDRTVEAARPHLESFSRRQLLRLPWHTGKGAAVRLGVTAAHGEAIVFMDADLATELEALTRALDALQDAEVAVGSRAIEGAVLTGHSKIRGILHRAFRSQVRRLTGLRATDPQCGFKAFRREVAKGLFAIGRVEGYGFDVEILLLAQKLRYRVVEVPVHWHSVSGSHVRVLRDSLAILRDALLVRLRFGRKAPLATWPIESARDAAPSRELVR